MKPANKNLCLFNWTISHLRTGGMPFISLRRNEYSIEHMWTFNFSFINLLVKKHY